MSRIVAKFGGTSVADLDRIRAVAARIKREHDSGHQIAVVVSAMAGVTNDLVDLTRAAHAMHDAREYDVVVSTGEQVTAGLLAICLQEKGVPARSWLGWQVPIRTSDAHARRGSRESKSRKWNVGSTMVRSACWPDSRESAPTTGSRLWDGADRTRPLWRWRRHCAPIAVTSTPMSTVFIPRIPGSLTRARKLDKVTYEEMLEMASLGAKVLQTRSVELAMNHGVPVQVLSSFDDAVGSELPGTMVVDEEDIVEHEIVSGVTYSRDEAKITLMRVADRPGVAAAIFGPLADANVNVDMIVQNVSEDGSSTDMTFTVTRGDLDRAIEILNDRKDELGYTDLVPDANVVKVSVVGVGMRSHAGVAQRMFSSLAERGINIQVISTSEIKISVLIAEEFTELALRALHTVYGLDAA